MSGFIGGGPRNDDGAPVFAPEASAYAGDYKTRFQGYSYQFPAGATTSFEQVLSASVLLQGGYFWVKNPALGDTVSLDVVDVDDILGGGAGAVVSPYVTNMPVVPWDHQGELESPTAGLIPAGLYLRITYTSTGADVVDLGVTYRWFVEG